MCTLWLASSLLGSTCIVTADMVMEVPKRMRTCTRKQPTQPHERAHTHPPHARLRPPKSDAHHSSVAFVKCFYTPVATTATARQVLGGRQT